MILDERSISNFTHFFTSIITVGASSLEIKPKPPRGDFKRCEAGSHFCGLKAAVDEFLGGVRQVEFYCCRQPAARQAFRSGDWDVQFPAEGANPAVAETSSREATTYDPFGWIQVLG